MGLADLFRRIFGTSGATDSSSQAAATPFQPPPQAYWDMMELSRRLGVDAVTLRGCPILYRNFTIPKRGGSRQISAPIDTLKQMQRRILRRLLGKLKVHPAVTGFEPGQSIVTNARLHARQAVVLRMDLRDFFPSTSPQRVRALFQRIGWDAESSELLTKLCTHEGGLPQGAPTSPRLSNLVNYRLDARLAGLAQHYQARYTRYADDMTFSFAEDYPGQIHDVIRATKKIVAEHGYKLHQNKKLSIRRRHQRQVVTGLVVNEKVQLPRHNRRLLRAVAHHLSTGRQATLTPEQLRGWQAFQGMVATARPSTEPDAPAKE